MRTFYAVLLSVMLLATVGWAEENLELGVSAGYGMSKGLSVSNDAGKASAGLKDSVTVGVGLSHNMYEHLSGELRYMLRMGDMRLSSGGTETTFGAMTHTVHYNLMVYATRRSAKIRPFVSGGAGIRIFQGTGTENYVQPLMDFALLTKTRELTAVAVFGGGVWIRLGEHMFLRAEVLDYASPAPTRVIAPVPGAKATGFLHDITPMITLGATF